SMATDYRFPAFGSSPYSVAFVYSVYSPIMDSINYICSTDAGVTWGVSQNISTSGGYFRKVSLAYGRSASASNGRYFAAWEQLGSSAARNGHIYTSRSSSTIIDSWISPINLDSVSTTMINLCRNPSIAVQYNNTDNDSSSVSAVVLVDRDYIGDGSDYDLLGFYNKRAHYTNYWYRLDIVNSGENDMFPDVTYDPGANNFLAVYFDSSNFKLPYIVNNMNLVNPSTWTTINPQYNDNLNLTSPFPRVEINPVLNQAAHVWIAEGSSPNGVAMFDAEYAVSNVGVQNISQEIDEISIFPNPIKNYFNISLKSKSSDLITVNIFDLTGKIVFSQLSNVIEGHNLLKVNIDEIASGNYIVNLQGQKINSNIRILVK
ncbi:MAG: T9SS type A sorting domain-containing protein, partial [Bacteroidetes bacterium]|nr:T9SS type A sorting domain-containing protein [Bacteroidota bacterium]